MRARITLAVFAVAGCKQVLGLDDQIRVVDAGPDAKTSLVITGDVSDPTGSTIPNATVRWESDPGSRVVASTKTDSQGNFTLVVPYAGTPLPGHFYADALTYL